MNNDLPRPSIFFFGILTGILIVSIWQTPDRPFISSEKQHIEFGSLLLPQKGSVIRFKDEFADIFITLDSVDDVLIQTKIMQFIEQSIVDYAPLFDQRSFTGEERINRTLSHATQYSLRVDGEMITSLHGISYRLEISAYTGGAHGMQTISAQSYRPDGTLLQLSDITNNMSYKQIAAIVVPELSKQIIERGGDPSDNAFIAGTEPTPKNFREWYLQGDSIIFVFNEYQVAAYALGSFEVAIPLSKFKDN